MDSIVSLFICARCDKLLFSFNGIFQGVHPRCLLIWQRDTKILAQEILITDLFNAYRVALDLSVEEAARVFEPNPDAKIRDVIRYDTLLELLTRNEPVR